MRLLKMLDSCTVFQGGLGNQLVISERVFFLSFGANAEAGKGWWPWFTY